MFNTCDKYGKLVCWFLHVIYFVVMLMNKHKLNIKKKKKTYWNTLFLDTSMSWFLLQKSAYLAEK